MQDDAPPEHRPFLSLRLCACCLFQFSQKTAQKHLTNHIVRDIIQANKSRAIFFEVKLMTDKYAAIRLKNQLCFPLYAVSNMITRKYKPLLDRLDLTYTQYIVMMVLWEETQVNEKFLCDALCLKSNTVTPLLQKLQEKGYINKRKDKDDERNLVITLTEAGEQLKDQALSVPQTLSQELHLTEEDAAALYRILYQMLDEDRSKTN